MQFNITGQLVDIWQKKIYAATITVVNGKIEAITPVEDAGPDAQRYILPGFIDSHVHIESSMLVPRQFALSLGLLPSRLYR